MSKKIFTISGSQNGGLNIRGEPAGNDEGFRLHIPPELPRNELFLLAELLKNHDCPGLNTRRMVLETDTVMGRLPVITLNPGLTSGNKPPLLLMLHGFEASKEKVLKFGLCFAAAGFFTVLMDAPSHGSRNQIQPVPSEVTDIRESWKEKLKLIREYRTEALQLLEYYSGDERVDSTRITMAGFSMGAAVTLLSAAQDPRVRAAIAMVPVSDFENLPEFRHLKDLADPEMIRAARLFDPLYAVKTAPAASLMIQCGADDQVVGPETGEKLNRLFSDLYQARTEDYSYQSYPGIGHVVSPAMAGDAVKWLLNAVK